MKLELGPFLEGGLIGIAATLAICASIAAGIIGARLILWAATVSP